MKQTRWFLIPCATLALGAAVFPQAVPVDVESNDDIEPLFSRPERLKAGGKYVKTEAPGWAAPAWADVNGDGHKDLVVGQFAGGKMKVYAGNGKGALSTGTWLEAGGEVAEVPGVW